MEEPDFARPDELERERDVLPERLRAPDEVPRADVLLPDVVRAAVLRADVLLEDVPFFADELLADVPFAEVVFRAVLLADELLADVLRADELRADELRDVVPPEAFLRSTARWSCALFIVERPSMFRRFASL